MGQSLLANIVLAIEGANLKQSFVSPNIFLHNNLKMHQKNAVKGL